GVFLLVVPLSASTINAAQANPLLTGLLLAGTAAAGRERWSLAAALVAAACLLKIYPIALALLFVVAFPRRFTPRFLAALAAGLGLGVCWMTVCGPTTEGGGYILVAPTLAWAFLESWHRPWPLWVRGLLLASSACFTAGTAVALTANAGALMAYGMHPIGGLL